MPRPYLLLLAFTITLAAVVGWRFSSESLVVVIGVLTGVAASIPTSLIVAWVATRIALDRYAARKSHAPHSAPASPEPAPRVIIVQTPAPPADPTHHPGSAAWRDASAPVSTFARSTSVPRRFTLLGDTADDI
jgi:hypothetical protein